MFVFEYEPHPIKAPSFDPLSIFSYKDIGDIESDIFLIYSEGNPVKASKTSLTIPPIIFEYPPLTFAQAFSSKIAHNSLLFGLAKAKSLPSIG